MATIRVDAITYPLMVNESLLAKAQKTDSAVLAIFDNGKFVGWKIIPKPDYIK